MSAATTARTINIIEDNDDSKGEGMLHPDKTTTLSSILKLRTGEQPRN